MSAIGSATARGPEMWWDTKCLPMRSGVGGFFEQGSERGVLQGLLGRRVVEHALERIVYPPRLAELLDRPAVVAGVAGSGLLRARDELLDRFEVRQPVVALDVPEDGIEELQRLGGE